VLQNEYLDEEDLGYLLLGYPNRPERWTRVIHALRKLGGVKLRKDG